MFLRFFQLTMNRNPKNKHLKRINAPKHWLLDKLSGVWAPRPSPGPHKLRECLPLIVMIRNRLKYALTAREVKMIVMSRHIRVDSKVRIDTKFPCGFQDVVTINRTGEHFRLIYDVKGRFHMHRIAAKEATWKLLRVRKKALGARAIPYIVTHDGRTIPYPDPAIKIGDTIKYDFIKNVVTEIFPFRTGTICMVTGGRNVGRVGIVEKVEVHPGSFDIAYMRDPRDKRFATRRDNLFIIGQGNKAAIGLPKTKGVKYTVIEEREKRLKKQVNVKHAQNNKKTLVKLNAKVLPLKVKQLREQTKEKKKLLKILRQQEAKQSKKKPTAKKSKKKKKQKPAAS